MLGHVRRHENKGETKSRYIAGKLNNLINVFIKFSLPQLFLPDTRFSDSSN